MISLEIDGRNQALLHLQSNLKGMGSRISFLVRASSIGLCQMCMTLVNCSK